MIHKLKISFCSFQYALALILFSVGLGAFAQTQNSISAQSFIEIDELVSLGAPGLALRILDEKQPALIDVTLYDWLPWQKKRLELLQKLRDWSGLVEQVNSMSDLWAMNDLQIDAPIVRYKEWFQTQQIKAYLQLGQEAQALALLQQLLWHADEFVESDDVAKWRRLIVQSYLQLNKIEDAQRAMRRYQQDYGSIENEDGVQWTLLQMQLLMRTHRYQEVIRSLADAQTDEEKAMALVAQLEDNFQPPKIIKQKVLAHQAKQELTSEQQKLYDFVLLKAVMIEKDLIEKVSLIERFLSAPKANKFYDVFYDAKEYISADSLWGTYEALGNELANKYKLLRGDDEAWYLKASNLFEDKPFQSKALYAVLAFTAQKTSHRALAFEQIIKLLDLQASGVEIINALFMKSKRIPDVEKVPTQVRYRLVDYALLHADLKTAAKLMKTLPQPPTGEQGFAWSLRRARILIMGNQHQQGMGIIMQLLNNKNDMPELNIDQAMQVLFDLQAIEQHALALQAFEMIESYPLSAKLQREIYFWKAESYQSMGNYEQAAYLFLKSSIPLNNIFDPWFHTASFKAAESLAQAQLIHDARRQYIKLLRVTKSAARKSVIKQRLQQLRLVKSKS